MMGYIGYKRIVILGAFIAVLIMTQVATQSNGESVDSKYELKNIERKKAHH